MPEILGKKAQFQRESATPGTYTTIAKVASIQPPQAEREVVELDDLDPLDEIVPKLAGLINAGEVTATLNFDDSETGHSDLEGDFYDGASHNYRIKLSTGKGWTFPAIVTGWAPQEISANEPVQVEVTLTLTGKGTFGAITP